MHPIVLLLRQARAERQALLDAVLADYPEIDFDLAPDFIAVLMSPKQKELWLALSQNLAELERYARSSGIEVE